MRLPVTLAFMRMVLGVDYTWDELRALHGQAERTVETVELTGEDWL